MFIIFVMAYVLGSIPTALWVGRLFFEVDIRELGSNNPGATNTLRVLGPSAAVIVLLIDVGKGALASYLPIYFGSDVSPLYAGLIAVVGHCFPLFGGFRGGKAIATTAGALLVYEPVLFLVAYLSFAAMILLTKYVFLGSISVGLALLVYSLVVDRVEHDLIFLLFFLFLIVLHRSNLRNFILGIEPKVTDKKLKKDRIPPPRK